MDYCAGVVVASVVDASVVGVGAASGGGGVAVSVVVAVVVVVSPVAVSDSLWGDVVVAVTGGVSAGASLCGVDS